MDVVCLMSSLLKCVYRNWGREKYLIGTSMRGITLGLTSIWICTELKEDAGFSPREMDSFLGVDGGFAYWKPKV